tara:strand:- start:913 stop:1161 length:249 start_codon:yes stop_codon:yes gene_type:complete
MSNHLIQKIETAVRVNGGAWNGYFRRHGESVWQCILFPSLRLTEGDYAEPVHRLSAPAVELSAAERKRNAIRHRANSADGHA